MIHSVNKSCQIRAEKLEWGEGINYESISLNDKNNAKPKQFDVIIGSDLLYDSCTGYQDLVKTICNLCGKDSVIIFGVRWRKPEKERVFFALMKNHGFEFNLMEFDDFLPCKLDWQTYGLMDNESSKKFLSQLICTGDKELPLYQVTEDDQNAMRDDQYDTFESLQIQIYKGIQNK